LVLSTCNTGQRSISATAAGQLTISAAEASLPPLCSPAAAAVYLCAVELLPVFEYDELEFQRR
jgi:hypothetical protein